MQAGMIYKMNDAFGMDLDKSVGASLVAGLLSVTAVAQVGRTLVVAGSVGLIPIPFSDALATAPIQAGMIYKMNDAFGMDLDKSVGASLVAGLLSVTAVAQVGRTLVNGFLKSIPVVRSVVGSATAVIITEGIGFAYLKVLEKCFNDETGEVKLPAVDVITSLFKENYLNLDTIKKLKS
ncbi:hypothetical protein [Helicobacter pylori]|uniref:hypothetical protein n=1 Tax=Helicobacter pylori TaxID=210 RepID=UPI001F51B141|nr:hypothetical protein [Helicobacter pylori]